MELDPIDKKLLNLLQADAKLPYADLAKRLGVSTSGIHKRVKRLIDSGVIKRFAAVVEPQVIGKKLKAFIGVATNPGCCAEVKSQLIKRPEVLEIHEVAGEHDLFLKLITDDTLTLNDILHQLDSIPGVSSTRTLIVLKTEKETSAVPIG
jgi:Lrp/AsnC family transcriptional regulator for asnA, asnC and gidA